MTFLLYQEMQLLLVQELQKRGYFRNSMDLCVSLWFGLQSLSLRRAGISAIGA